MKRFWNRNFLAFARRFRYSYSHENRWTRWQYASAALAAAGAFVVQQEFPKSRNIDILGRDENARYQVHTDHKLTKRELRFLQFASIEYDDVIYMSPMDFIDSLTLDAPRERVYRRVLKEKELKHMLKQTPSFRSGNKELFRSLDQNGIISYSEYIFLLTLITKSKSSFKIAFLMFDGDDNGKIDKNEFLLKSEEQVKKQDTTLLLHLFGQGGNGELSFDQFRNFYENLQEELMEIEFHEFARGKATISPMDFARLILRYTIVNKDDYHTYLNRVKERTNPDDRGVTLRQWANFSLFLNDLEEFSTAVRLYASANMPVSPPEFARAVLTTTGEPLDPYVVSLMYRIFDANNDQTLSYPEFLAVMNDRLHRGLKGRLDKPWGWRPFKNCVINELSHS